MKISYPITSKFNAVESFREGKSHLGLDFAMEGGTPLRTINDGIVSKIVNQPEGLGKAIYVDWGDGKTAIYGHMQEITARVGDKVTKGDILGLSGNTGNVVGSNGGYHLHFAIKEGNQFINPEPYAPLIQGMNQNFNLNQGVVETKTQIIHTIDLVNPSLEQFISTLSELKMYFITQLLSIPKVPVILDLILSWIY